MNIPDLPIGFSPDHFFGSGGTDEELECIKRQWRERLKEKNRG